MKKISVVVPIYNSGLFISETINSIVNQTFKPFEILIIDDGSTDNSCKIVSEIIVNNNKEINIKLIKGTHNGPGSARNIGIVNASSEWIAFLDSDDFWYENKLQEVVNVINENNTHSFFCHNEHLVKSGFDNKVLDYSRNYKKEKSFSRQLYNYNLFSTSAVVCLKNDLLKVGGFDENLSSAQDYDLWLKMSDFINPFFIKKTLGVYTVRDGNISSRNYFKRLKNIIHVKIRHRSKGGVLFLIVVFKTFLYYFAKPLIPFLKKIFKLKN